MIFIYASLDKLFHPAYFAISIQNYQIIPDSLINLTAVILPWLEFYCGILLLLGFWHRAGVAIIALLNVIFIFALTSALFRGLDIDCGCFGSGSTVSMSRIVEDLFLLAFSVYIFIYPTSKFALENIFRKTNVNS